MTAFDYGCGRGGDLKRLSKRGIHCSGWDPLYQPDNPLVPADVVNLSYVINVIEDPRERVRALTEAWRLAAKLLIVSARLTNEQRADLTAHGDGFITDRQTFLASQHRRRQAAPHPRKNDLLFEQHRVLLEPLMDFVAERGRLPSPLELEEAGEIERKIGGFA